MSHLDIFHSGYEDMKKQLLMFALILCGIVTFWVINVEASFEPRYQRPIKISNMIFFKNVPISNFTGKNNIIISILDSAMKVIIKNFLSITCYESTSSSNNCVIIGRFPTNSNSISFSNFSYSDKFRQFGRSFSIIANFNPNWGKLVNLSLYVYDCR